VTSPDAKCGADIAWRGRPGEKRQRGGIDELPSGALRVRCTAGRNRSSSDGCTSPQAARSGRRPATKPRRYPPGCCTRLIRNAIRAPERPSGRARQMAPGPPRRPVGRARRREGPNGSPRMALCWSVQQSTTHPSLVHRRCPQPNSAANTLWKYLRRVYANRRVSLEFGRIRTVSDQAGCNSRTPPSKGGSAASNPAGGRL